MGNPKALVHLGGERMTKAEADARPERLPFDARRARARPDRRRALGVGDRRPASDGRARGRRGLGPHRRASTTSTRSTSSCGARAGRGRDRVLHGRSTSSRPTCTTRSSRSCARTSAAPTSTCRRSPAGWTTCRTPSTSSSRTRSGSAPNVFAIDQDPDGVTVHFKTESGRFSDARRLRDRHGPLLRAAHDRDHHALLARQAARHPPAQLPRLDEDPVPGRATASGRTRTASSAAARSPSCRSAG